jgi:hypothetical protein
MHVDEPVGCSTSALFAQSALLNDDRYHIFLHKNKNGIEVHVLQM